jgi:hypothetical protein
MSEFETGGATGPVAPRRSSSKGKKAAAAGLIAAGALAGGVITSAVGAEAATPSPSAPSSSSSAAPEGRGGIGGAAPVRSDETQVTGTKADTLRAAALRAVPGGTVVRIETDAGDAAYEVHMTKADGTVVTVKFNEDLSLLRVESGMGQGDPAPAGGPRSAGG